MKGLKFTKKTTKLFLKKMAQSTGSPVPQIKARTVKWRSRVAPVGAAASLIFFGIIKYFCHNKMFLKI